jgi:hypothetical protein
MCGRPNFNTSGWPRRVTGATHEQLPASTQGDPIKSDHRAFTSAMACGSWASHDPRSMEL